MGGKHSELDNQIFTIKRHVRLPEPIAVQAFQIGGDSFTVSLPSRSHFGSISNRSVRDSPISVGTADPPNSRGSVCRLAVPSSLAVQSSQISRTPLMLDPHQISDAAKHLFEHLHRSGLRYAPKSRPEQVEAWGQQFATDQLEAEPVQSQAAESAASQAAPLASPVSSAMADPAANVVREAQPSLSAAPSPATNRLAPVAAVTVSSDPYPGTSLPIADRQATLETMAQSVAACTRCEKLASCRTHTVFGEGNATPRFVFFGEAPGVEEDACGSPFVGRGGQLLTKMIQACRLSREEVYLMNTVKCHPPGNRNPDASEIANCREYFEQQFAVLRPEYIICLGAVPSQSLLKSKLSIGRLRQRFHQYHDSKVLVIYHPAYLLRNPDAKKAAWADLQLLMKDAGL